MTSTPHIPGAEIADARLRTLAERLRKQSSNAYYPGQDEPYNTLIEVAVALEELANVSPQVNEAVTRKEAYTAEQLARLTFAIYYSSTFCAPQNIESVVKEIDCCPGCEDTSSSGATCYKFERGEFCPNSLAEDLRNISAALYGTPGLSGYREAVWGPGAPHSFIASPSPGTAAAGASDQLGSHKPLFELGQKSEPCGECHLQPGETCDICGVHEPMESPQ